MYFIRDSFEGNSAAVWDVINAIFFQISRRRKGFREPVFMSSASSLCMDPDGNVPGTYH